MRAIHKAESPPVGKLHKVVHSLQRKRHMIGVIQLHRQNQACTLVSLVHRLDRNYFRRWFPDRMNQLHLSLAKDAATAQGKSHKQKDGQT